MRWWKGLLWRLEVWSGTRRREVLDLRSSVGYWHRTWVATDALNRSLAAGLKDCAEASREESERLRGEIAQRDAEIHRLTLRLAVATANHAPLARYVSAIRGVQVSAGLIPAVEAAKVGVYRSQDRTLIMATFRPLSEEDSAGWELLGTDEAIKELQRRTRMAMGVWN